MSLNELVAADRHSITTTGITGVFKAGTPIIALS
jgi:hypothetical protein